MLARSVKGVLKEVGLPKDESLRAAARDRKRSWSMPSANLTVLQLQLKAVHGGPPRPPNVPLLRALWSLLDGILGSSKGSWRSLPLSFDSEPRDAANLEMLQACPFKPQNMKKAHLHRCRSYDPLLWVLVTEYGI